MIATRICEKLEQMSNEGRGFDELLVNAVHLLHESNPQFHWTGIYELLPRNVLRLGPYIGAPTDHVLITVGDGVCGSAVAEKRNKNIPDVTREPNYLACSSTTKSELVVLIRKKDKIYAQIDIDSHDYDAFGPDEVEYVQRVADWLADVYEAR